jgi:hypothetical protein
VSGRICTKVPIIHKRPSQIICDSLIVLLHHYEVDSRHRDDYLDDCETEYYLSVTPFEIFSNVVVNRGTNIL